MLVTVDRENEAGSTDTVPDETILHLLEEHKALPTNAVVSEVEGNIATIRNRLQMMADVGLIERRETVRSDVWLIW